MHSQHLCAMLMHVTCFSLYGWPLNRARHINFVWVKINLVKSLVKDVIDDLALPVSQHKKTLVSRLLFIIQLHVFFADNMKLRFQWTDATKMQNKTWISKNHVWAPLAGVHCFHSLSERSQMLRVYISRDLYDIGRQDIRFPNWKSHTCCNSWSFFNSVKSLFLATRCGAFTVRYKLSFSYRKK